MPTNKRRQASKTPTPPGAAGTTKPKDHDKEKITNKNIMLISLIYFRVISTSADLLLSLPFLIRKLSKVI